MLGFALPCLTAQWRADSRVVGDRGRRFWACRGHSMHNRRGHPAHARCSWLVVAVWALGGVYVFFCTVSVTELATMLPREGGWYVYSRKAFGKYAGFVVGCCD
jgi:Amino acid permease